MEKNKSPVEGPSYPSWCGGQSGDTSLLFFSFWWFFFVSINTPWKCWDSNRCGDQDGDTTNPCFHYQAPQSTLQIWGRMISKRKHIHKWFMMQVDIIRQKPSMCKLTHHCSLLCLCQCLCFLSLSLSLSHSSLSCGCRCEKWQGARGLVSMRGRGTPSVHKLGWEGEDGSGNDEGDQNIRDTLFRQNVQNLRQLHIESTS